MYSVRIHMQPKKIIVYIIPLAITLIIGMVYFVFFYGKAKVAYPVSAKQLNFFASEYFIGVSLKYPKYYSVQDYSKAFKVLSVSKDSERRLEIFHPNDFGPRVEPADIKEKFTLGPKNNFYVVWLFYPNNDIQSQSELRQIFNSIKID